MKPLANVRKAVAGVDDTTFTRWIKEPGRHKSARPTAPMPADATGTRFPSRVLPVAAMKNLLVTGHSNVKIGRDVRKGKLKGYRIFTLSLEERATCPSSCLHWTTCYGNAMPFGKRIDHTDPAFLSTLEAEIDGLMKKRWAGVLIRLHALGDFYSFTYIQFWRDMLRKHPRLVLFGYTARSPIHDAMGRRIWEMNQHFAERSWIRFSNAPLRYMATRAIGKAEEREANSFICPEQTDKVDGCGKCALCWSTERNVSLLDH